MKILYSLLAFLVLSGQCFGGVEELNDTTFKIRSVVKAEKEGEKDAKYDCTAFCYKVTDDKYYCLTCGHCYKVDDIEVYLSHSGEYFMTKGKILVHNLTDYTTNDYSILSIEKKDLGDYRPLIPVKFADSVPKAGIIWSHGCSGGAWPTLFKGRILDSTKVPPMIYFPYYPIIIPKTIEKTKDMIHFSPPPAQGRSGSGLFNEKYELIGMVQLSDGKVGAGVSVETLKLKIKEFEDEQGN